MEYVLYIELLFCNVTNLLVSVGSGTSNCFDCNAEEPGTTGTQDK